MKGRLGELAEDARDYVRGGFLSKSLGILFLVYLLVTFIVGIYWSGEPSLFSVQAQTEQKSRELKREPVVGFTTTTTLIKIAETLLDKPGGYLSNDKLPPGLWLDNIPNWEFGVLVQVRDMARALRRDMSRSQSQSVEDADLTVAEPQFHFDSNSWAIPSSEGEYRQGVRALNRYLIRLSDPAQPKAQFYARADNLRKWLSDVDTRLGSLSRRLSESVGKQRMDESLSGDIAAAQSTGQPQQEAVKTPWNEIDDVFYEARGYAWALSHLLRAIEIDFRDVLDDKNARVSLRQIILELEASQQAVWSPMILNGSGFGLVANHSLTMASYLSRVDAAIIDLRELLSQG